MKENLYLSIRHISLGWKVVEAVFFLIKGFQKVVGTKWAMAPRSVHRFLLIIVFIISIFQILHCHSSSMTSTFECLCVNWHFFSDYRSTNCKPLTLPPVCCLPTRRRRRKKRGKYATILWQSRTRCYNPPLQSMFIPWTIKWTNLHARINFQWDTANCSVMAFTETWLDLTVPDSAIASAGFSIYGQDRTRESG